MQPTDGLRSFKMGDKIVRKEGHRQVFVDYANEIADNSKNASFLSDEDLTETVRVLKGENSKWAHSRSLVLFS